MRTYEILVCETNIRKFIVEAENRDEAHDKAVNGIFTSSRMIDSSWETEDIIELTGETK